MSHTLLILKINTTFKDVQIMLKQFFDISTGFRFSKLQWVSVPSIPVAVLVLLQLYLRTGYCSGWRTYAMVTPPSSESEKRSKNVPLCLSSNICSAKGLGGKYLFFESSRSVKMRGFSFLSLHAFWGKCVYFSIFE